MKEQKKLTTRYFNDRSKEWAESVYNSHNRFDRFPTSLVRDGIIYDDIAQRKEIKKVTDFGCGSGEMVIELLQRGYEAKGFDIAEKMIYLARRNFKKENPDKYSEEKFVQGDVESYHCDEPSEAAIATGVIEYLEEDLPLLRSMSDSLKEGGVAYIACRNQLFNTTTGNVFTLEELKEGNLERLISEFNDVEKYSPVKFEKSLELQNAMLEKISTLVSGNTNKFIEKESEDVLEFPSEMKRRFHSPADMDRLGKKVGMNLEKVIYFHFHPYPPEYANVFPGLFNALSLAMQPLGETSLGAHMCSGFVAIYKKEIINKKSYQV